MDERSRRVGLNEALFREVNERIEELQTTFAEDGLVSPAEDLFLMCECGDQECARQIVVPYPEYERVRTSSTRFTVATGHGRPEIEEVLERHPGYDVVRKNDAAAAALAEALDPRS